MQQLKTMKIIRLLILNLITTILVVSSVNAMNYPTIVTEKGINHSEAKKLVYSVPEDYFRFVNKIIFTNKKYAKCKTIDTFGQKMCWKGWANAYWNKKHICTSTNIIMADLNRARLIHETNHIYDYCINKVNISTEKFADNFRI